MNIQKYIDLRITPAGKTCRSAFWITTLLHVVIFLTFSCLIGNIVDKENGGLSLTLFYIINAYLILVPIIYTTMLVRRMHDIGKTAILPMCWLVPYLFVEICNVVMGPVAANEVATREMSALDRCVLFALLLAGICLLISMIFAMFRSKETENS